MHTPCGDQFGWCSLAALTPAQMNWYDFGFGKLPTQKQKKMRELCRVGYPTWWPKEKKYKAFPTKTRKNYNNEMQIKVWFMDIL